MLPERLRCADHGGVVDEQIDRAQLPLCFCDPPLNIALPRDVSDQAEATDRLGTVRTCISVRPVTAIRMP